MFADLVAVHPMTLAAIAGMAIVTYSIRAGGLFLIRRASPTPFVEAWLGHVPGAMFMALVVPGVAAGGPADWIAAGVTVAAARLRCPFALTLVIGIATAAILRPLL